MHTFYGNYYVHLCVYIVMGDLYVHLCVLCIQKIIKMFVCWFLVVCDGFLCALLLLKVIVSMKKGYVYVWRVE